MPPSWIGCWHKGRRCAMLWEIEIKPKGHDPERDRVCEEYTLLTHARPGGHLLRNALFHKVLANDAIEQVIDGPLTLDHLALGAPYRFELIRVPLRDLDDSALQQVSRQGQLSLNLAEMRTIQDHFRNLGR